MSDCGGSAGANVLSEQLSGYRLLDSLMRSREDSRLALNHATLHQNYVHVVKQHNNLAQDYNTLRAAALDMAKRNQELVAMVSTLQREKADLQQRYEAKEEWHQAEMLCAIYEADGLRVRLGKYEPDELSEVYRHPLAKR